MAEELKKLQKVFPHGNLFGTLSFPHKLENIFDRSWVYWRRKITTVAMAKTDLVEPSFDIILDSKIMQEEMLGPSQ